MRTFGVVWACGIALLLGSCGKDRTQVIVFIDAEPRVLALANSARVRVVALDSGQRGDVLLDTVAPLQDMVEPEWALSVALSPRDRVDDRFLVEAMALNGSPDSRPLVTTRGTIGYVSELTRSFSLVLDDTCVGVECDALETCRNAQCYDVADLPERVESPDATEIEYACRNGVKDGDETDDDCGGSCVGCLLNQTCEVDDDCLSGECREDGGCTAPTPLDGGTDADVGPDADLDGGPDAIVDAEADTDVDAGPPALQFDCELPSCPDPAEDYATCPGELVVVESITDAQALCDQMPRPCCLPGLTVRGTDLRDMSFVRGLRGIQGALVIVNVRDMRRLAGLEDLGVVSRYIEISRTGQLSDVSALQNLETVTEALRLQGGITDPHVRFPLLRSVSTLEISSNSVQSAEFPALTNLTRALRLIDADLLTSFSAPVLPTVGPVEFKDVGSLEELDLPLLREIGGFLRVEATGLSDLSGLATVVSASSDMTVRANTEMTTIGMAALRSLRLRLVISDNGRLQELDLDELDSVGTNIIITNNPMLPTADADALVDGLTTFDGERTIEGNME